MLNTDGGWPCLFMWKRILQFEGYRVVTASNGREGLVAANEVKPDLIITDRSMPIMDGVEFCRHLKREREFSRIPVILTSADHPGPDGTAVWDGFWLKPPSLLGKRRILPVGIARLLPNLNGFLRHVHADDKTDDQVRIAPSGRQNHQAGRKNTEIRHYVSASTNPAASGGP
jgi:CheY-like chemotaxis protein